MIGAGLSKHDADVGKFLFIGETVANLITADDVNRIQE